MKRLLLTILLFPFLLSASELLNTGTLIVTYQTDSRGERLDRVRFWLKNEFHKQTLYPRGTAYVNDTEKNTRMVVIEDLPPGTYTIEFILPNRDGRFSPVPQRQVKIARGEVIKIDQEIKPIKDSRASRHRTYTKKTHQEPKIIAVPEPEIVEEPVPELPLEEIIVQTSLEETEEENTPEETEEVNRASGKLIVSFEMPEKEAHAGEILFRLISESGSISNHPILGKDTVVPLQAGKMVMIQSLPTGSYTLEFYLEGREEVLAEKRFEIQADRTKSVHQNLSAPSEEKRVAVNVDPSPKADSPPSLTVTANISSAEFKLRDLKSGYTYSGEGKETGFQNLPSGQYELKFYSNDPFFIPPAVETIEISEEHPLVKEAIYMTLGKLKISTNIPKAMAQITPMEKGKSPYKKEVLNGETSLYIPEGRYRITFQAVKGREIPEPVDIDIQPLQMGQVNVYFVAE